MKIQILRSSLATGLKAGKVAVAGKSATPILANVLVSAKDGFASLTTTNIDTTVHAKIACDVMEPGEVTLPHALLSSIVSKLDEGTVTIEAKTGAGANQKVSVRAGASRFSLGSLPAKGFPSLPTMDDASVYVLPSSLLSVMLDHVSYASSIDDTRRSLRSVLLRFKGGKLTVVATDGRRLSLVEKDDIEGGEADFIVPSQVVGDLIRHLKAAEGDVTVSSAKSQIRFSLGDIDVYSKLIDDTYPEYGRVIPSGDGYSKAVVDRLMLLEAIDRVSVLSTAGDSSSVTFGFQTNMLVVSAMGGDAGDAREELPIKYMGEPVTIRLNQKYIMDPLRVLQDDEVTIEFRDGAAPIVVKCSLPFVGVVMPLRTA